MRKTAKVVIPVIVVLAIAVGCYFYLARGDNPVNPANDTQTTGKKSASASPNQSGNGSQSVSKTPIKVGAKIPVSQTSTPAKPPTNNLTTTPTSTKHQTPSN